MENSEAIEKINQSNEFESVEWNKCLCVDHSYLDYEKKILSNEISFSENENFNADLNIIVFRRKLIEILNIGDDRIFKLSIPVDVIQRIEDAKNQRPFSEPPMIRSRLVSETMIKKKENNDKKLSFLLIGTKDEVLQKLIDHQNNHSSTIMVLEKEIEENSGFDEKCLCKAKRRAESSELLKSKKRKF